MSDGLNADVVAIQGRRRRTVGVLTVGERPDVGNFSMWGVYRSHVVAAGWKSNFHGRKSFVIELLPDHPWPPGTKAKKPRPPDDYLPPIALPIALRRIEGLALKWAEIADDQEAAPTGSMLRVINRLLVTVKQHRKLLRRIRKNLATSEAITWLADADANWERLVQDMDALLGVRTNGSK